MTAVALPSPRSAYLPLAMNLLKSAAGLGAACWAVGVLLTYTGAHSFAVAAGYGDTRAWLFPLTLDVTALVAYLALLMLPKGDRWYPLVVVVVCAGASAAAQGYHQAGMAPGTPDLVLAWPVRFAAGAWPAAAALLAGHLVWMIVVRAIPAGLVSALRQLADTPTVYVDEAERLDTRDTGDTAELEEESEPVVSAPPRLAVSAARVHVPPSRPVTADVGRPAGRPVGQAVAVSGDLLDRVRAGELTANAAARLAGCHPRTIRRRLEAA